MNKFRQGFHYSLFDSANEWSSDKNDPVVDNVETNIEVRETSVDSPEALETQSQVLEWLQETETTVVVSETQQDLERVANEVINHNENLIDTTKNKNNTSISTKNAVGDKVQRNLEKKEQEQNEEKLQKELEKQLMNLAKNKKIDFDWTNNEWKCSGDEKKLATSSAKVFSETLSKATVNWIPSFKAIFDMCREKMREGKRELTKEEAQIWKTNLGINSKEWDIQNFYKAFLEYQNRNTQFTHLQGFMWFLEWLQGKEDLMNQLKANRSQKIEKSETKDWQKQNKEKRWNRNKETWNEIGRYEAIKKRTETIKDPTEQVLALLCDFNFDWEVNAWDVWYRTWTQFANVFRTSLETQGLRSNDAIGNLVEYATKMWINMTKNWVKVTDLKSFYEWMTYEEGNDVQWYNNTKQLQNLLQNSSADFSDILTNWANAWKDTLDAIIRAEKIWNAEVQGEITEAINGKVSEILEEQRKKLNDMKWLGEDKKKLIMTHLENQLKPALRECVQNWWTAVGVAVPLIKWINAGLNVWISEKWEPILWLSISYGGSKKLSENTNLAVWANIWTNLLFIPCVTLSAEIWTDVKALRRNKDLKPMWVSTLTLWANVWVFGWLPTRWLSVWYENDKKWWIEKQAKNIHNVLEKQALPWVTDFAAHRTWIEVDDKKYLRDLLSVSFEKASPNDLDTAAENLWRVFETFKFDEKTTEEDKQIYAKVIADVFTDQWKNSAMIGITDNKRKISWWRLWVQFFAWFIPGISAVLKFTKYRNARTEESDNSKIRRVDAMVNWTWNRKIDLKEWSKYLGQEQVDLLNQALKWYWATKEVEYKDKWLDGQPLDEPRIVIPASLWKSIGIDVRVSADMAGYVKLDKAEKHLGGEVYYSFPANATYRLFLDTWLNQKTAILNIGWMSNKESDVKITDAEKMNTLNWDKKLTDGKIYPEWWQYTEQPVTYEESTEVLAYFQDQKVNDVIKKLDSYQWKKSWKRFSEFMKNKVDALWSFEWQKTSLITVLQEYIKKFPKEKLLTNILNVLQDANVSPEGHQLLMDRLMSISAKVDIPNKKTLDTTMSKRKWYKEASMKWPNGQAIFNKIGVDKYRSSISSEIKEFQWKIMPDIVGATAFYHRNNTSKWLALTWLWVTSVLGWTVKSLEGNDKQIAKEWFLWSEWTPYVPWVLDKEKSPMEWNNLKNVVTKHIKSLIKDLKWELSEWDIKKLLKWEEIELDNSSEKIKIKLDVDYVFYLMWECANESVGMRLWNLHVLHQVDDARQWELYFWEVNESGVVKDQQLGIAVGIGAGIWKKEWWWWETWQEWKIEWPSWNIPTWGSRTWTWNSGWWMMDE